MVLNSTPGVYATQQGGGDGDARINIRGFNQRNVAVMLDGLPVNDMENGWVYWSNWFGLDAVTRNIQVQRGLGASKLALPSVGGTMNIITAGIQNKRKITIKQSVDVDPYDFGLLKQRTSFGYNSGKIGNGWGVTLAGSYKKGDGYVEQTQTEGAFFYAKINKRFENHILSVTAMGAPQSHTQRSYKRTIATYDSTYAAKHGVDTFSANNNYGIRYNQHWGMLKRDRTDPNAQEEVLNEKINKYHKPMFSLRDFWTVNEKLSISNILYMSLGNGGGTRARGTTSLGENNLDSTGHIDWQSIYDYNAKPTPNAFGGAFEPIEDRYSETEYYSSMHLARQMNNHNWYGLLSTANYEQSQTLSFSGGVDVRSYKGVHYEEVYDLLGGDYVIDINDTRNDYDADPTLAMKRIGDKEQYYYEGLVNWGGAFTQAEYKRGNFSSFVNVSGAYSGYKKVDYFEDTASAWKYVPSFTIKGGTNYNLSEKDNVFMNTGYLSKARDYRSFFKGYSVEFAEEISNEKVVALELGYSHVESKFAVNVNTYFTQWKNKATNPIYGVFINPEDSNHDDRDNARTVGYIPGMDARHMGVETDFAYKISKKLSVEGLVSLGDWIWDKEITGLQMYYSDDRSEANIVDFDATGIHVGDAAQTQFAGSIRYEPIKGLYFMGKSTFFDRYYSDFNPEDCQDAEGNPKDSWQTPSYNLVDFHAGYKFKFKSLEKTYFNIKLSVYNVLDEMYISDAKNNDQYSTMPFSEFDAKSATVFFGMGRRFNVSLKVTIL
jgi:hypothetical protein